MKDIKENASAHSNTPTERMMACKLTSPELQKRKATVISNLKRQLVKKQELADGYQYQFKGTDELLDELLTFMKTERMCCDFFDFTLQVAGNASNTWLSITGPQGAKAFIQTELEF